MDDNKQWRLRQDVGFKTVTWLIFSYRLASSSSVISYCLVNSNASLFIFSTNIAPRFGTYGLHTVKVTFFAFSSDVLLDAASGEGVRIASTISPSSAGNFIVVSLDSAAA